MLCRGLNSGLSLLSRYGRPSCPVTSETPATVPFRISSSLRAPPSAAESGVRSLLKPSISPRLSIAGCCFFESAFCEDLPEPLSSLEAADKISAMGSVARPSSCAVKLLAPPKSVLNDMRKSSKSVSVAPFPRCCGDSESTPIPSSASKPSPTTSFTGLHTGGNSRLALMEVAWPSSLVESVGTAGAGL